MDGFVFFFTDNDSIRKFFAAVAFFIESVDDRAALKTEIKKLLHRTVIIALFFLADRRSLHSRSCAQLDTDPLK